MHLVKTSLLQGANSFYSPRVHHTWSNTSRQNNSKHPLLLDSMHRHLSHFGKGIGVITTFRRNRSRSVDVHHYRIIWPDPASPLQCGSGSVATVVLRDRYACELCDAPVNPLGVRSYRESSGRYHPDHPTACIYPRVVHEEGTVLVGMCSTTLTDIVLFHYSTVSIRENVRTPQAV